MRFYVPTLSKYSANAPYKNRIPYTAYCCLLASQIPVGEAPDGRAHRRQQVQAGVDEH